MMKRDRAYYRWQRKRTIKRKLTLLKRIGGDEYVQAWTHGKPGRLAKGILERVMLYTGGKVMDDMTVLTAGIWEK